MHKCVLGIFATIVFFWCKPNKAIIINKNSHGINDWSNKYIYSKVIFMIIPKRRFFNVLLHNKCAFVVNNFRCIVPTKLTFVRPVFYCSFKVFLCFHILIVCLLLLLKALISPWLKLLQTFCNKNSFALAPSLRLNNKHSRRVLIALLLCHNSICYLLVSFL